MSDPCATSVAVLLGELPASHPGHEGHVGACPDCQALSLELEELDRAVQDLPLPRPSEALVADTLALLEAEMASEVGPDGTEVHPSTEGGTVVSGPATWFSPPRIMGAVGLVAAAALALFVVLPGEAPVDTSRMVERGLGERAPDVTLKVAVDRSGQLDRLRRDQTYTVGDTLYFRAKVDSQAWLALVRIDPNGASVVHTQRLPPGEADLALQSGPLAWQLESTEGNAVFALLAANEALPINTVEAALSGTYDPGAPDRSCAAAHDLGARCSAAPVRVNP